MVGPNVGHVKYSVTTGAAGSRLDPAGLAALAVRAEEAGWDAFFLEDYVVYQGQLDTPTWDPWICLAAMAAATKRIRLGTTVTPVPRRRPWQLALEAISVDRLSGGRLILGVGAGDPSDPFLAMESTSPASLAKRLDDGLAALATLLAGERVNGARLAARPVQRPRIPLWVGGDLRVPAVRRRILRWDGSTAYGLSVDGVRELVADAPAGFDVKIGGVTDLGELEDYRAAGATWSGRWVSPNEPDQLEEVIRTGPVRV